MFALVVLAVLFYRIITQGIGYINLTFLQNFGSRIPEKAGINSAVIGSFWLMGVVAPVSLILGVGTAIYLEEYAKKNKLQHFIQMNISNLAGVPSIVFGLLGLTVFVTSIMHLEIVLSWWINDEFTYSSSIIVAAQEAIRAVPRILREASFGMGATKWQTIRKVVLPTCLPGILTGVILALSRAIGETAPLIVIGIPVIIHSLPEIFLINLQCCHCKFIIGQYDPAEFSIC